MDREIEDLDPALQPLAQKFLDLCNSDPVFTAADANWLHDAADIAVDPFVRLHRIATKNA